VEEYIVEVKELSKIYSNGIIALDKVSFKVRKGEFLVIIGLSGSGKSTLLRCINRIHEPSSGDIIFEGENILPYKNNKMREIRSRIGMIFQHFNLISGSVLTNVLTGHLGKMGLLSGLLKQFSKEKTNEAKRYIDLVGLKGRENSRADKLSGGQQQRVAIARSLMQHPTLLMADEPVASLDPATSHAVMDHLKKINEEMGVTIICNLHFLSLVRQYATKVIALKQGRIVFEGLPIEINEVWFKKIYGEEAIEVTVN